MSYAQACDRFPILRDIPEDNQTDERLKEQTLETFYNINIIYSRHGPISTNESNFQSAMFHTCFMG